MRRRKNRVAGTRTTPTQVEWHTAPDFAEVAEALRVNTSQIMAVRNPRSNVALALYTLTDHEDDKLVYSVLLKRSADGTLFVSSTPQAQPGLWEYVLAQSGVDLRVPKSSDER